MTDKSYIDWVSMTDQALSEVIGRFVQDHRLNQNKSQSQLSEAAGISRSTLSLLERGEKVNLNTLIKVLRVLDLLYIMDVFKVHKEMSPLEYSKMKKKERKRASGKSMPDKDKKDLEW